MNVVTIWIHNTIVQHNYFSLTDFNVKWKLLHNQLLALNIHYKYYILNKYIKVFIH